MTNAERTIEALEVFAVILLGAVVLVCALLGPLWMYAKGMV